MTARGPSVSRNVGGGVRVILVPDPIAINKMLSGRSGDLKRVMAGFAGRATVKARQYAGQRLNSPLTAPGRRTGNYERSIHASFPRPDEFRLQADVDYAAALEKGARPHIIRAKNAPMLKFYWQRAGRWHQDIDVFHPGNRPYKILTDAVLDTARDIGF